MISNKKDQEVDQKELKIKKIKFKKMALIVNKLLILIIYQRDNNLKIIPNAVPNVPIGKIRNCIWKENLKINQY
jgi:hypothetical protein